jgi:hypothetical protein
MTWTDDYDYDKRPVKWNTMSASFRLTMRAMTSPYLALLLLVMRPSRSIMNMKTLSSSFVLNRHVYSMGIVMS